MLSKKGGGESGGLGRWLEPAGTSGLGLGLARCGVGLDADAINATCTDATQLTHTRV